MTLPLELPKQAKTEHRGIPLIILAAMLVTALVIIAAVFGAAIAPYAPDTQRLLIGDKPPSAEFLAGTDLLGRDVLSRVIFGARTALVGPIVVAAGAFSIATLLGLLSGYLGGLVDSSIMRWVDFMLALPGPLVAIVVVGVVGGGYWIAVTVLVILFTAPDTRIVRSAVLEQRTRPGRWASPRRASSSSISCPMCCRSCWPMSSSISPSRWSISPASPSSVSESSPARPIGAACCSRTATSSSPIRSACCCPRA